MGDKLEVIRRIGDKEIKGIGKIDTATADKIMVLRIRFMEEGKSHEAIYLIDSDLDNYGIRRCNTFALSPWISSRLY